MPAQCARLVRSFRVKMRPVDGKGTQAERTLVEADAVGVVNPLHDCDLVGQSLLLRRSSYGAGAQKFTINSRDQQ